ncbi:hypothetical protein [Eubacterium oxidoreducens]|uniref:Uncharacterized protein n=1 Tax=Eubacterium oxidoreducens TaxID=1732 RepID=A0A1G6BLG0_EUBOX|nr:hypothetical protein [Eubacterium oxidoreducens]SDB21463.1 hypothetical protein SAMN02910417_01605 [Eubacterium oxidoreducens]
MYVEKRSPKQNKIRICVAFVVAAICVVIVFGIIYSLHANQIEQQKEELEKTILEACVQCYAVEGIYPENISYLEENYGVVINHDKFVISYEAYSANLLPEVRVLVKGE